MLLKITSQLLSLAFIVKLFAPFLKTILSLVNVKCMVSKLGGDKALTMTMTPWNLAHGQWSKNLTMTIDTFEFAPWSMVKYGIFSQWSNMAFLDQICGKNLGRPF